MARRQTAWVAAVLFAAAALAGAAAAAGAADRVLFEAPLADGNDAELRALAGSLLDRARSALDRLYGRSLRPVAPGSAGQPTAGQSAADYRLATVVMRQDAALVLSAKLIRARDGQEAPPIVWMAAASDDLPLYLARSIFARWSGMTGAGAGTAAAAGPQPVLVDELATGDLRQLFMPLAVAALPDGSLAVSSGSACLLLDRAFRIVGEPGRELAEKADFTWAGWVSATPGGTLVLRPTMGKELYRIPPGPGAAARRIALGLEASQCYHAAMPDGSVLVIDFMKRRAFRLADGRRQQDLPLFTGPNSWIAAFAVALDGSIWVWDQVLGGARIHTADGVVADYVLPLGVTAGSLVPTAMAVGPDGDMVLFSNRELFRFRRDGSLAWRAGRIEGAEVEDLPTAAAIAVDWPRGLVYLADTAGARILKLLDPAAQATGLERTLLALRAGKPFDDPSLLAGRARLYEEAGSLAVAKAAWRRASEADPSNAEAASRLAALELAQLAQEGDELAARARDTLAKVGVENARPLYQQAVAKYELVLARAPADAATRRKLQELQRLFSEGAKQPPFTIREAKVEDLFPAMMQRYRARPVGSVTVENPAGGAPITDLEATLCVPPFTGSPSGGMPVARLPAGSTATLELRVDLGQQALENEEDLPVPGVVEVSGTVAGARQSATKPVSVLVHRRTALTWEETGRIAAFITPNEQTVSDFAARLADTGGAGAAGYRWHLSARLTRAMRICEGLAAHGIAYVEDPDTPIARALGAAGAVDTVRFARDTLSRHAGDCDDTTVLLASLLESSGIPTAVLTTPGHIFLAFDSGEPAASAPLLAAGGLEAIASGAACWIPVETTVLQEGFMAAWKAASTLVVRNRGAGALEFLPVRDLRTSWPALALPKSTITVVEPAASAVDARMAAALAGFEQGVYAARLAELDAQAAALSGRKALAVRLQQGILHALFGRLDQAEAAFSAAIRQDPAFASPYADLANIRILRGDVEAALAVLRQGLARSPASAVLNLAMARCFSLKGDRAQAGIYLARAEQASPGLAARYRQLAEEAPGATPAARASSADSGPALLWSSEE